MEKGKEEREEEKGRAEEKERRKEGMKKGILRPGRRKKGKAGKSRESPPFPLTKIKRRRKKHIFQKKSRKSFASKKKSSTFALAFRKTVHLKRQEVVKAHSNDGSRKERVL